RPDRPRRHQPEAKETKPWAGQPTGIEEGGGPEARVLPQVAGFGLGKKICCINRCQHSERQSRNQEPELKRSRTRNARYKVKEKNQRVSSDNKGPLHEPTTPLWSREDQIEAFWVFQIPN